MKQLPTKELGPFSVSSIGLGCMNLSHAYGTPPPEDYAIELLNRALDLGVSLLDTAALYGFGKNERLLSRAVMHRRDEFTLASKCVLDIIDGQRGLDGSPDAITRTLDGSLDRLGVDHIDLLYLHRLDKRVPIEDSVGALVRAKEVGKITSIGLSEMSAGTIQRAHAVHPIAAVQSEYSPMVRNPDIAVLDTCKRLGIAFVAFSPVGRGLLAGAIRNDDYEKHDIRRTMPRFMGEMLQHNLAAVDRFNELARRLGITSAQLSIAWALSRGDNIIALPGTRSIEHLEEDLGAIGVTLDDQTLTEIDDIFAPGAIRGARYAAGAQAQVDTELLPYEDLEEA